VESIPLLGFIQVSSKWKSESLAMSVAIQVVTRVNIKMDHRSVFFGAWLRIRRSEVGPKKKGHSIDGSRIQHFAQLFCFVCWDRGEAKYYALTYMSWKHINTSTHHDSAAWGWFLVPSTLASNEECLLCDWWHWKDDQRNCCGMFQSTIPTFSFTQEIHYEFYIFLGRYSY
jgi:hypothetical protein